MSSGYAALALAALIGAHSPALDDSARQQLIQIMDGHAAPGPTLTITARAITCRAGDVDIAAYGCALNFGSTTLHLSGQAASNLFATLLENGVQPDGAAGSIYAAVQNLSCTIEPGTIARKDGSGASCHFAPGP